MVVGLMCSVIVQVEFFAADSEGRGGHCGRGFRCFSLLISVPHYLNMELVFIRDNLE
jgi:hypothetical protein